MFVLIFILLCHQVVWEIRAEDSSVSVCSGRKMQFTKHDHFISNEFWYKQDISHLYIKDPPSLGCDFCIKQQETLRHWCDPSLECYHGNGSRVWWTAEFGTLDLKVVQAVPSPGASHAH